MFTIYSCDNCKYYLNDEYIVIEGAKINIYYIESRCLKINYDDKYVFDNMSVKMFIKDAYYNDILFLWINRTERNTINENILYSLSKLSQDIHILVV